MQPQALSSASPAGLVRGPGSETSDSIPAALSDGEVVIPADLVRAFGAAQILEMVRERGQRLPKPKVKEGVVHAAVGGLIDDPMQPTAPSMPQTASGAVTRIGNGYSGGNVSGSISVNGQAPGGTTSYSDPYRPPPAPAPAPPATAAPPTGLVPPAPGTSSPTTPSTLRPGQQAAPTSTVPPAPAPAPAAVPAPAPVSMDRNAEFYAAAERRNAMNRQPFGFGLPRRLGFARGGLVDAEELQQLAEPRSDGAVFGIYPKPGSRFSTNANDAALSRGVQWTGDTGPNTFAPAAPAAATALAAPARSAGGGRGFENPAAAMPTTSEAPAAAPAAADSAPDGTGLGLPGRGAAASGLANVARAGNTYTGAPGISGDITVNGRDAGGGFVSAPAAASAGSAAAPPLSDLNPVNPNDRPAGLGIIGAVDYANRNAAFNEGAALRTAAARGSWSPRRGFQGDEAAIAAAGLPVRMRAQAEQTAAEQAGATARALTAERAADARFGIVNRQNQAQNALAERRLELEDRRVGIEDRKAAQAAGGKVGDVSTGIRKEFEGLPEVKNYKQALPSFRGIEDAAKRSTPMSDINMVYGIAKLYDPNSVVREGEYSTVANAPGIPERVKGWAQYLQGGGKLTPEVKQQIMAEARSRMQTFDKEYGTAIGRYSDIASRSGADASLVVPQGYQPAVPAAGAGPAGAAGNAESPQLAELRRRAASNPALAERLRASGY